MMRLRKNSIGRPIRTPGSAVKSAPPKPRASAPAWPAMTSAAKNPQSLLSSAPIPVALATCGQTGQRNLRLAHATRVLGRITNFDAAAHRKRQVGRASPRGVHAIASERSDEPCRGRRWIGGVAESGAASISRRTGAVGADIYAVKVSVHRSARATIQLHLGTPCDARIGRPTKGNTRAHRNRSICTGSPSRGFGIGHICQRGT
jgi:hypothetical protein